VAIIPTELERGLCYIHLSASTSYQTPAQSEDSTDILGDFHLDPWSWHHWLPTPHPTTFFITFHLPPSLLHTTSLQPSSASSFSVLSSITPLSLSSPAWYTTTRLSSHLKPPSSDDHTPCLPTSPPLGIWLSSPNTSPHNHLLLLRSPNPIAPNPMTQGQVVNPIMRVLWLMECLHRNPTSQTPR